MLNLENLTDFWGDDTVKSRSDFIDALFNYHPDFLGGIRSGGNQKGICTAIFKTQSAAINAMEMKRNNAACVFEDGNPNTFKDKWWFSKCIPNIVVVNKWNTIIEVSCYHLHFEEVEDILYSAASEIANQVDELGK